MLLKVFTIILNHVLYPTGINQIIFYVILVLDKGKPVSIAISLLINDMESFFLEDGLNVLQLDYNIYDNLVKVL